MRTGEEPRSNGRLGLEIVRVLEAATISMGHGGEPVQLSTMGPPVYGHSASTHVTAGGPTLVAGGVAAVPTPR